MPKSRILKRSHAKPYKLTLTSPSRTAAWSANVRHTPSYSTAHNSH